MCNIIATTLTWLLRIKYLYIHFYTVLNLFSGEREREREKKEEWEREGGTDRWMCNIIATFLK